MIEFTVYTVPVAQPRQRHRIVATKAGKMFTQNYVPVRDPVNLFKSDVRKAASEAYQGEPLRCPLAVRIVAVFPRQAGKVWKNKPMPSYPKVSKPDLDNLAKSTLDCLTSLLFVDDAQVCRLVLEKWHASGSEQPHVVIQIEQFGTGDGESQSLFSPRSSANGKQEG